MRYYEATATISADPGTVWQVLIDGVNWPAWDSGVDELDGQIALGKKIKIRSQAAPGRSFPVRVTTFEPGRLLRFSGGIPLGLFKGVRTHTLTSQSDGTTVFHLREEYSGPLLGLVWRSMPNLGPSFTQFTEGLKRRVETGN
jgi:hypothetical protein